MTWYHWVLMGLGAWTIPAGVSIYTFLVLRGMDRGPLQEFGLYCINPKNRRESHRRIYHKGCTACESIRKADHLFWAIWFWPFVYIMYKPSATIVLFVARTLSFLCGVFVDALEFLNPTNVGERLKKRRAQKETTLPKAEVVR